MNLALDVAKVCIVVYMLVIAFLSKEKTHMLYQPIIFVMWLVAGLVVLLLVDIVLGVTMLFALILTFLVSSKREPKVHEHVVADETRDEKEKYENKDFCEKPLIEMEDSAKALEKYIVDDYLEKAAESGLIKENQEKLMEPLSEKHMDIQGTNSCPTN